MLTKKFCYLRTNDFDDLVVCENLVYNKKNDLLSEIVHLYDT
jgi:hypothetical protein